MQPRAVRAAVGGLGRPGQPRQRRVVLAVAAVVSPHREEDFLELRLAAGPHARPGGPLGDALAVPQVLPRPHARCHQRLAAHAAVDLDHLEVGGLVRMVVVPVDQFGLGGDLGDDVAGDIRLEVVVVVPLAAQAEVHVRPDHRPHAEAVADGHDLVQVIVEHVEFAAVAEAVDVLPASQVPRLVHADVEPPAAQVRRVGLDHLGDQLVGGRLIDQHDAAGVLDGAVDVPFEDLLEVRQCLDAADQFDAQPRRVIVELLELGRAVCAAQEPEHRLAGQLVGVLGVEHDHVVAHQRQPAHPALGVLDGHHRVARAVEHDAQGGKGRALGDLLLGLLRQVRQHQAEPAQGVGMRAVGDVVGLALAADLQAPGRQALGQHHRRAARPLAQGVFLAKRAQRVGQAGVQGILLPVQVGRHWIGPH